MTEAKAPDLTPPNKKNPNPAATAVVGKNGAEKPPKAVKAPKDPNAPSKARTPRVDYGFSPDSVIRVAKEKEAKYRGHRKEWFDTLVKFDGQKVSAWFESCKERKDPPRGWLRFFVQDGSVSLEKPAVQTEAPKAA